MLVSTEILNNLFKDFAIIGAASLVSLHEILSRPVALETDIFVKIENTAFSLAGFRSKVVLAGLYNVQNMFRVLQ